mgnify:CR=1 FL=1
MQKLVITQSARNLHQQNTGDLCILMLVAY